MKLGLHIAYWGLGLDAIEQLQLVKEAERAGFSSVWVGEAYGSDAATVLAWLAAQTQTIELGSGIFQMPARSPAMTAPISPREDSCCSNVAVRG
jgi:alkanesulfonate monooxygenase SsuD/methylene tetrahydromethanopterin reductase-like flavin-dependent oxidoreductase (luciferase family)